MGIRTHIKTTTPETLKLADRIASFMFEQEFGEMKHFTTTQKEQLEKACKALYKVVNNNKVRK